MGDLISHRGIVEHVSGITVSVKIVQHSACSGCKVKSMCSSAESKEKTVDVTTSDASNYKVGEEVMVYAGLSTGRTAVLLAFVIPLILMVVGLVVTVKFMGLSEPVSILISLLLVGIYYLVLGLNRKRIDRRFQFFIAKTDTGSIADS